MSVKIGKKDQLVPSIPQEPDSPDQALEFKEQGYTVLNDVGLQTEGLNITDGSKIIGQGGSKIKVIEGITPDFNKPDINIGKSGSLPLAFKGQTRTFNRGSNITAQSSWDTDDMKRMAMLKNKSSVVKVAPALARTTKK